VGDTSGAGVMRSRWQNVIQVSVGEGVTAGAVGSTVQPAGFIERYPVYRDSASGAEGAAQGGGVGERNASVVRCTRLPSRMSGLSRRQFVVSEPSSMCWPVRMTGWPSVALRT
jgi:hypothetical protein